MSAPVATGAHRLRALRLRAGPAGALREAGAAWAEVLVYVLRGRLDKQTAAEVSAPSPKGR